MCRVSNPAFWNSLYRMVGNPSSAMYSTPAVTVSVPVHMRQSLECEMTTGALQEAAWGKSLGWRSAL